MKIMGTLSRFFTQAVAVKSPSSVIKAVDAANQASHKAGMSVDEVLIGHEAWPKAKLQAHREAADQAAEAEFARFRATGNHDHLRVRAGHVKESWLFYQTLVRLNRSAGAAPRSKPATVQALTPPPERPLARPCASPDHEPPIYRSPWG